MKKNRNTKNAPIGNELLYDPLPVHDQRVNKQGKK